VRRRRSRKGGISSAFQSFSLHDFSVCNCQVMALATMAGKNVVGRLGAEMDVAPIVDVIKVVSLSLCHLCLYMCRACVDVQHVRSAKRTGGLVLQLYYFVT
jgi:uncharacterized protein YuzB (UPF0349 family)